MKKKFGALIAVIAFFAFTSMAVAIEPAKGVQLAMGKNPCSVNPCTTKNPCATNPCATNPCATNPCAANPCAANPCAVK